MRRPIAAELTETKLEYGQPSTPNEISLLGLASVVLRWRWRIALLAFGGGVLGLLWGLTSTRQYKASAMFIPQATEATPSGLAAAAGQLGILIPTSGGVWGPPMYVSLLSSRTLLEPVARDTVVIAEQNGRRVAIADLLEIREPNEALRVDETVQALMGMIHAAEVRTLGAVQLEVITPWPSVSLALAQKLVSGINRFNVVTRKSQATAERQFVETQAADAERALLAAEDRLRGFLERNRVISSPDLVLERDRLQRNVQLRQQLYTSLLQSREETRIREVRDTPVITVIEEPRLPTLGEPRRSIQKGILGGIAGAFLGLFLALVAHIATRARREGSEEAQEFFTLVEQATPGFLRKRLKS
jgi:hypothetical protein